jgi:hypothetical protein
VGGVAVAAPVLKDAEILVEPKNIESEPVGVFYRALYRDLSYSDLSASTPTYGAYVDSPTMPSATIESAPTAYPTFGYLPQVESAGFGEASAPSIEILQRLKLTPIELIEYEPDTVEQLNVVFPDYEPYDPATIPSLETRTYTGLGSVTGELRTLIATNWVFDSDRVYDDLDKYSQRKELFGTQKILADSAARGFPALSGPAVGAVSELLNEIRVERREVSDKARDESYERTKATVVEALAQAVAVGTKHSGFLMAHAAKTIEAVRLNVQMAQEVFNSAVEAYNTRSKVIRTLVSAYREYVQAVLKQDEAVVARIAAERAKLDTYKADVDMFRSQVDLYRAATQVNALSIEQQALVLGEFEITVEGHRQNAQIAKTNLESYRQAVGTLSVKTETDLARVRGYADAVEAEASKLGVMQANFDAYASFYRTEGSRGQSYTQYVDASLAAFNAEVSSYKEYGQAQRDYLRAKAAEVEANKGQAISFLKVVDTALRHNEARNRAAVEVASAQNTLALAVADHETRVNALNAQAFAEQTRIDFGLKGAEVAARAGIAQAAYSTTSVSARLSDDGNYGRSITEEDKTSIAIQGRRTWSQTTSHEEDAAK